MTVRARAPAHFSHVCALHALYDPALYYYMQYIHNTHVLYDRVANRAMSHNLRFAYHF